MPSISCESETIATLHLDLSGQPRCSRVIREDECLAVGSNPSADVCLIDDEVASTHCIIIARGGVVTVRDCFSETGTFVDRVRIREIQLQTDAELRVGGTTISVKLSRRSAQQPCVRDYGIPRTESPSIDSATTSDRDSQAVDRRSAENRNAESPCVTISNLESQLQQANAEIEVLQNRLTSGTIVSVPHGNLYEEEMLELLRAEILDLQTALADRDQIVGGRLSATEADSETDNMLSKPEAEKLVERLEQLLQELQQRDDQIAMLTELLETAEAANRSEREERSQIDSWLRDIEQRCSDRELEWRSQRTKLQSEMEAMGAERDRAEAALHAKSSSVKLEAAQNVMTSLRDTAESQRQKLHDAEQIITQLQSEVESTKHAQPREERMQLAEERSEIARLRQELEMERQRKQNPAVNDENLKFQALRQHLNEIHVQDQKEREEREERKLSSRITRLWHRLDGR